MCNELTLIKVRFVFIVSRKSLLCREIYTMNCVLQLTAVIGNKCHALSSQLNFRRVFFVFVSLHIVLCVHISILEVRCLSHIFCSFCTFMYVLFVTRRLFCVCVCLCVCVLSNRGVVVNFYLPERSSCPSLSTPPSSSHPSLPFQPSLPFLPSLPHSQPFPFLPPLSTLPSLLFPFSLFLPLPSLPFSFPPFPSSPLL